MRVFWQNIQLERKLEKVLCCKTTFVPISNFRSQTQMNPRKLWLTQIRIQSLRGKVHSKSNFLKFFNGNLRGTFKNIFSQFNNILNLLFYALIDSYFRSRNTADFELVSPPLPLENPLIQLYSQKQQKQHQKLIGKAKQNISRSWLPFLEVITYAGPHRRLVSFHFFYSFLK